MLAVAHVTAMLLFRVAAFHAQRQNLEGADFYLLSAWTVTGRAHVGDGILATRHIKDFATAAIALHITWPEMTRPTPPVLQWRKWPRELDNPAIDASPKDTKRVVSDQRLFMCAIGLHHPKVLTVSAEFTTLISCMCFQISGQLCSTHGCSASQRQ